MFATAMPDWAVYDVTVRTNPTDQTSAISGAADNLASANITDVTVTGASRTSPS